MTTHSQRRHQLGPYLIGSLDPVERAEVEDHLTGCRECRDELATLSAVPALLLRSDPPTSGADSATHQRDMEKLTKAAVSTVRHRIRRRKVLGIGAVVTLVAVLAGVFSVKPSGNQSPERVIALHPATEASGIQSPTGSAALESRPWGTQIALTLDHLPKNEAFMASVSGSAGDNVIGSWGSTSNGHATVDLATFLHPRALNHLYIRTIEGTVLLET